MEEPFFSIVIPTRDRPESLRRCLDAVAELRYPASRAEILVVDDGSREPIAITSRVPFRIRLMRQENTGPAGARNRGIGSATGEYVAFLDDDCRPHPDWLMRLAEATLRRPGAVLGGQVVNALSGNIFAEASQSLVSSLYEYYAGTPEGSRFFTSNNLVFPAQGLRDLGGFDTSYPLAAGEDRDICYWWKHQGGELIYVPEAIVYHEHRLTARKYWRQQFNYGRGAWTFHRKIAERRDGKIRVEPLSFYTGLLTWPLRRLGGLRGLMASALIFTSQVANAAGFFCEKYSRRGN